MTACKRQHAYQGGLTVHRPVPTNQLCRAWVLCSTRDVDDRPPMWAHACDWTESPADAGSPWHRVAPTLAQASHTMMLCPLSHAALQADETMQLYRTACNQTPTSAALQCQSEMAAQSCQHRTTAAPVMSQLAALHKLSSTTTSTTAESANDTTLHQRLTSHTRVASTSAPTCPRPTLTQRR